MSTIQKNTVLIVDDEAPFIEALTMVLSPKYTIYVAKDGQSAMTAAKKFIPDIILLDVLMPEMNGYDVIAELKNSNLTRNIPVIFITGYDSQEDEERGLNLGAVDYITKPFSPEVVRMRVQNQLEIVRRMNMLNDKSAANYEYANKIMNDTTKNSVLVVDDESMHIASLNNILSPAYTVYSARNGADAIKAAEKHLPSVILLDVMMPVMDGFEALSAIKQSFVTHDIPVVLVTSLSDSNYEEKGLSLGAADYITKPFSSGVVKLRVNNQIKVIRHTRLLIEESIAELQKL
jgi:PleD family two-component response regulator